MEVAGAAVFTTRGELVGLRLPRGHVGLRLSPDAASSARTAAGSYARRERHILFDPDRQLRHSKILPALRRKIQESLGFPNELRQHRLQVAREYTEQVEPLRADLLHERGLGWVFGEQPRLVLIDVEVRTIGELHDLAHGGGEIEPVIEAAGDRLAGGRRTRQTAPRPAGGRRAGLRHRAR